MANEFIRWLSELNKNSGPIAGGKGANLAEIFNSKFPVPPAFVVTTKAYYHFIEKSGIKNKIFQLLDSINVDETEELESKAKEIRQTIVNAELPDDLAAEILEAYEDLSVDKKTLEQAGRYALGILKHGSEPIFVAVRSSATTEDLSDSSFAGQQESYLNIKGNRKLIEAVKKVFASLFTARAIYYRKKRGFSKEKFSLAVVVQKMIDSEKSGVMFSRNPVKNDTSVMVEAVFGLGEGIVSGMIKPDNYEVSRDLEILDKRIAEKKVALVRNSQGDTEQIKLTPNKSKEQVLKDSEIKRLADYAMKLEEHYDKPQDIEFSVEDADIYIVQTRPITTKAQESKTEVKGDIILSGLGASPGLASGKVKIIMNLNELNKVQKGDILVTEMTNPDMVVTMQRAAAIVTDEGGITSHAAIVSREMGIPAVVGTEKATKTLKDGQVITVDGFNGRVYEGFTESKKVEIKKIVPTKTKIKVIVDIPAFANRAAESGCEAVGLLRLEGIIASSGKHPIKFQKEGKESEYSKLIQTGIEQIAEHFKEVWVRTSDIRSDEFSHLDGAPKQVELNPMLGMHGIRFSLKNPSLFKAELNAIKHCAEKFPHKTFGIMMPQVISPEEVIETKKLEKELGMDKLSNIKRGIMVETPAACLIIKNLLDVGLDFISFGTNDLTQYVLAIDRGNEQVQYIYNELHPAVTNAIKRVLRTCEEHNVESSICGQAGSNKQMVEFLIKNGIKSISVNADAAHDVSVLVSQLESSHPQNQNQVEKTNFQKPKNDFKKEKNENNKPKEKDYSKFDKTKKEYVEFESIQEPLNENENKNEEESVLDEIPELPQISDEELKDRKLLNELNSEKPDNANNKKEVPNYVADDYSDNSSDIVEEEISNSEEKPTSKKSEDDDVEVLKEINEDDIDEILDIF
ncbi:MAG: phosphoenolpyruvate synthase [Candidatus Pacearchaeota archaeon]